MKAEQPDSFDQWAKDLDNFGMPENLQDAIEYVCENGDDPIASLRSLQSYIRDFQDGQASIMTLYKGTQIIREHFKDQLGQPASQVTITSHGGMALPRLGMEHKGDARQPLSIGHHLTVTGRLVDFTFGQSYDKEAQRMVATVGLVLREPYMLTEDGEIDYGIDLMENFYAFLPNLQSYHFHSDEFNS
ncbi:MAG TPA: hypothetical protein VMT96_00720 [Candidatus Bathyarchaeia archaeon]|nr:hypothetical protein [Candidatus Bathyarchaeia archaeon]